MQQKLFKNTKNDRKTCEKRYGNTASWETKMLYILSVIGKLFNFKVVHALENESNFSLFRIDLLNSSFTACSRLLLHVVVYSRTKVQVLTSPCPLF